MGAILGSVAGRSMAARDDTVGDVVREAGSMTDATIDRLQDLAEEYEVGGKVRRTVKQVDEDYQVRDKLSRVLRSVGRAVGEVSREVRGPRSPPEDDPELEPEPETLSTLRLRRESVDVDDALDADLL